MTGYQSLLETRVIILLASRLDHELIKRGLPVPWIPKPIRSMILYSVPLLNGVGSDFPLIKDSLKILTEIPEQADALQFYCSGGGNFIGDYGRIDGDIRPNSR